MQNKLLLSFFFLLLGIGAAYAQDKSYTDEEQEACQEDAVRLCSEFVPDVDRVTICMKQHFASLTPRCAKMFDERPQRGRRK